MQLQPESFLYLNISTYLPQVTGYKPTQAFMYVVISVTYIQQSTLNQSIYKLKIKLFSFLYEKHLLLIKCQLKSPPIKPYHVK